MEKYHTDTHRHAAVLKSQIWLPSLPLASGALKALCKNCFNSLSHISHFTEGRAPGLGLGIKLLMMNSNALSCFAQS